MTKSDFLSGYCPDIEALAAAVIRQSGGWKAFKESAMDMASHGIGGGFHGWIYYADTVGFFKKNREQIAGLAIDLAQDCGIGTVEMIKSWRCMDGVTEIEIMGALSGIGEPDAIVANGLAWFAAEEVARRFSDAGEG